MKPALNAKFSVIISKIITFSVEKEPVSRFRLVSSRCSIHFLFPIYPPHHLYMDLTSMFHPRTAAWPKGIFSRYQGTKKSCIVNPTKDRYYWLSNGNSYKNATHLRYLRANVCQFFIACFVGSPTVLLRVGSKQSWIGRWCFQKSWSSFHDTRPSRYKHNWVEQF